MNFSSALIVCVPRVVLHPNCRAPVELILALDAQGVMLRSMTLTDRPASLVEFPLPQTVRGWVGFIVLSALAVLFWLVLAWMGNLMKVTDFARPAPLIQPVAGFALFLLMRFGLRSIPAIIIGSLTVGWIEELSMGWVAAGAVGKIVVLLGLIATYRHFLDFRFNLERIRDVMAFIFGAVALGGFIFAVIDLTVFLKSQNIFNPYFFRMLFWPWWLSAATGFLVVAPFLLVWTAKTEINWNNRQTVEVLAWLAILISLAWIIFGNWAPSETLRYPLELTMFPVMTWAAVRFGQRGATMGVLILALLALYELVGVVGPEAKYISQSPIFLWMFVGVLSVTSLVLAGVLSEVRRSEAQSRENEARLLAFVRAMPDVAFVIDAKGVIQEVFEPQNRTIRERVSSFRDCTIDDAFNPGLAGVFHSAIEFVLAHGASHRVEYAHTIDGVCYWFEGRVAPVIDEGSRRVIWVAYEITERKRAEAALQQRDALLAGVAEAKSRFLTMRDRRPAIEAALNDLAGATGFALVAAMQCHDEDGPGVYLCNRGTNGSFPHYVLIDLVCGKAEQTLRKGEELAIHSSDPSLDEKSTGALRSLGLATVILSPIWVDGELWGALLFGHDDPAHRWDESTRAALRVTAGSMGAYLINLNAEQALLAAVAAANHANLAKSEFLAMMSHEIRTPMNALLGYTDLLGRTELDETQQEYAGIISRSGKGLLELINNILDFSKIESKSIELEEVPFDPEMLAVEVLEMAGVVAREKGLKLDYSMDPPDSVMLVGDPFRIKQVLLNLVNNAVKFTARGGVTVAVEVVPSSDDTGRLLNCRVTDTGIGIPEAKRDRLFQPFTQVDSSTTRKYGGTGLGLVICQRLVQRMGGEIGVDSSEGQGSTFWYSIPLRIADACDSDLSADSSPDQPAVAASPSLRILICEDDRTNQRLLLEVLASLGSRAEAVDDGISAWEKISRNTYDIIFMDIEMPGMDGWTLVSKVRAELAVQPCIVAVTAHAMSGDRKAILEGGFDYFVAKPIDVRELAKVLNRKK